MFTFISVSSGRHCNIATSATTTSFKACRFRKVVVAEVVCVCVGGVGVGGGWVGVGVGVGWGWGGEVGYDEVTAIIKA